MALRRSIVQTPLFRGGARATEVVAACSEEPKCLTPCPFPSMNWSGCYKKGGLALASARRTWGKVCQPSFASGNVLAAWLGAVLAITTLGLISAWSHYPLVVAPLGASTVLPFGHPRSPLAQTRKVASKHHWGWTSRNGSEPGRIVHLFDPKAPSKRMAYSQWTSIRIGH